MDSYQEDVNKLLISCVISRKGGVPLNEINNDFKMLTGYSIPFLSLGYQNLVEYLLDVKDIYFIKNDWNEDVLIAHSMQSKHLIKLVDKQACNDYSEDTSPDTSFSSLMNNSVSSFNQYNYSVLLNKNISDSINPIVYGHQLLGDDIFVEILGKHFNVKLDWTGPLHSGLCICGQNINDLIINISQQKIFASRVAVMIGLVDLLNGKTASEMIHEFNMLLKQIRYRKLVTTFFTIPFIKAIPRNLETNLKIFNKYMCSQIIYESEFINVVTLDCYYEWMYNNNVSPGRYGNELLSIHERDLIVQNLEENLLRNLNFNEE